ncbi:MAG TPA: hypothetical protein PKY30_25605, partial [Myxococcota bacterium]|nr:hypothetical protein [Myxococcota bacterium]
GGGRSLVLLAHRKESEAARAAMDSIQSRISQAAEEKAKEERLKEAKADRSRSPVKDKVEIKADGAVKAGTPDAPPVAVETTAPLHSMDLE